MSSPIARVCVTHPHQEECEDSPSLHDGDNVDHACELADLAASSFSAAFGFGEALAQLDALGTQR